MEKKLIGLFVSMLLIATIALPIVVPANKIINKTPFENFTMERDEFQWDMSEQSEDIKISINRGQYRSEEEIAIMIENIGEKTLIFNVFPKIKISDENGNKVFPSYIEEGQWALRPGEYEIYVWDQLDLEEELIKPQEIAITDVLDEVEIAPWIIGKGYVVLVAGDATGHEDKINDACREIYDDLIQIGYTADDIQFLNTIDSSSPVDDDATEDTVEHAVKVWADSRVSITQPLFIIMFDHGGGPSYGASCCGSLFRFCVYNTVAGDYVYPADLRDWIDDLHTSTNARVHVWQMACHSGGFIPDLSQDNFVTITSTVADQHTSVGPSPYYEYFTGYFWPRIVCGWSWLDAFNYGSYHSHQDKTNNVPQLDDDGNGEGHGVYDDIGTTSLNPIYRGYLPHHGDGYYAQHVYMGDIHPICFILVIDWELICSMYFHYESNGQDTVPIWATIDNKVPLAGVKALLLDPNHDPMECGCFSEIPSESYEMSYDSSSGQWKVDIPVKDFEQYDAEEFTIVLTAEGKEGETATPHYTKVSFAANPKPDTQPPFIEIYKPGKAQIIGGELEIKGAVSDDQEIGGISIYLDNKNIGQYSPKGVSHYQFKTTYDTNELSEGFHVIKVEAYDAKENMNSKAIFFTFVGAPAKPQPPKGTTNGKINTEYTYTAVANDPQNDKVWLLFDWGDGTNSGWLGPFESGNACEASHSWSNQGDFDIRVKAKDIFGKSSEWSDPLPVTMPKNKPFYYNFNLLEWLINQFPNAFPILKYILG